ncbi:hypothetical protein LMH73_028805 [Vibrio splendidus]|nr:hypothetical protein [Vibrio splendidus]MCC4881830.1 hypothetical protein [Vibrio splendidus]
MKTLSITLSALALAMALPASAARTINLDTISLDHIQYKQASRDNYEPAKYSSESVERYSSSNGVIESGVFLNIGSSGILAPTIVSSVTTEFLEGNFGVGYRFDLTKSSKNKFTDVYVNLGIGQTSLNQPSFVADQQSVSNNIATVTIGGRYGSNFDNTEKLFWTIGGEYSAKEDMFGDVGFMSGSWGLMYAFTPSISMNTSIGLALPISGKHTEIYNGIGFTSSMGMQYTF